MRILCVLFMVALMGVWSTQAHADTKKDFDLLAKAVSFIKGGPKGDITMAVVFDPANGKSVSHADSVMRIAGKGIKGGGLTIKPKKVLAGSVGKSSAKVFFITKGLKSHYTKVLNKAAAVGGLTVSTDTTCMDAGACVLIVKTKPSVDIIVSTAASSKTGTEFASAFSMMITKK